MEIGDQFVILEDQSGAPVGTIATVEAIAEHGVYLYSWDGSSGWGADPSCVAKVDFDLAWVNPGDQVVITVDEAAAPVGEIVTVDQIQNGDFYYTWGGSSGWATGEGTCAKIMR